jgi:predicted RNA-binding protein with PIN domain
MRIIIDGYNLFHVAKQRDDVKHEQAFIAKLVQYKQVRGHDIMLVFDGGTSLYETEKDQNGVNIVYSGYAQNADMVIIHWLKQQKDNQQIIAVTSDTEIRDTANHCGIVSIDSESFYELLLRRISEKQRTKFRTKHHDHIRKITTSENPLIDALLSQSSVSVKDDDVFDYAINENSTVLQKKQLSKDEKVALQIIEKL